MGRKGKVMMRSQQQKQQQYQTNNNNNNASAEFGVQNQFMNNEFLQFYANLHVSSVMFSDPEFQARVMFPFVQLPTPQIPVATTLPSKNKTLKTSSSPGFDEHHHHHHKLPHHERRLAEVANEEEDSIPSSAAKMNSLSRKWNKMKQREEGIGISSGLPFGGAGAVGGELSQEKRRVSFSKNSPRWNLITPPPPKPRKKYFDPRKPLPQMAMLWSKGGEINFWSSDMEESDTTETTSNGLNDNSTNNSSTLEEETTKENVPTASASLADSVKAEIGPSEEDSSSSSSSSSEPEKDLEQMISDSTEKLDTIKMEDD